MNATRNPKEIMKARFDAAEVIRPVSLDSANDDDPDLHRNAPRPDRACLYGLLERFAEAGSATTEANPYAVAFNALVYLSAGVGRGPFLAVGNTWHHGNLFGLHVGRSGRGRKGDAASLVHRVDRTAVIEPQHLTAAHAWVRYWTESVLYVFAEAADEEASRQTSETAQRIVEFLKSRGHATRWELSRDCLKGHAKKDQIDAALDELLGASPPVIEIETVPRASGSGSPTKFYRMAAKSAMSEKCQ